MDQSAGNRHPCDMAVALADEDNAPTAGMATMGLGNRQPNYGGNPRGLDLPADDAYREAMSRLAAGVVMVTCHVGGRPWGMTATACCSVSMAPPLIMVSLAHHTVSKSEIERSNRFGVSVLGSRGLEVARFAARPGEPKFIEEFCLTGASARASATPVVRSAQAHVDCAVNQIHQAGDHTLFIGVVRAVVLHPADRPLVYHSRNYY